MTAEIMKGYKVVSRDVRLSSEGEIEEKYESCIQFHTEGGTEYKINEWTTRNNINGPLAVFENTNDARTFISNNFFSKLNNARLFKCEYEPSKDKDLWFSSLKASNSPETNHGLLLNYGGITVRRTFIRGIREAHDLPDGTKLAERVKITREVFSNE